jgi:DNA polymerase III delta prime subunit
MIPIIMRIKLNSCHKANISSAKNMTYLFSPELEPHFLPRVKRKIINMAPIIQSTQPWVEKNFSGYPCPPYKIIVLDEADSMTEDAKILQMQIVFVGL